MPDEVKQRLAVAASMEDLRNITDESGATYCVRCLLWRPPPSSKRRPHHCRTCNRCVVHFDHHCGVFGRCIAGTWRSGNLPYFFLLIAMGAWGPLTCFGSILASVSIHFGGWQAALVVVSVLLLWALASCCGCLWVGLRQLLLNRWASGQSSLLEAQLEACVRAIRHKCTRTCTRSSS